MIVVCSDEQKLGELRAHCLSKIFAFVVQNVDDVLHNNAASAILTGMRNPYNFSFSKFFVELLSSYRCSFLSLQLCLNI